MTKTWEIVVFNMISPVSLSRSDYRAKSVFDELTIKAQFKTPKKRRRRLKNVNDEKTKFFTTYPPTPLLEK